MLTQAAGTANAKALRWDRIWNVCGATGGQCGCSDVSKGETRAAKVRVRMEANPSGYCRRWEAGAAQCSEKRHDLTQAVRQHLDCSPVSLFFSSLTET